MIQRFSARVGTAGLVAIAVAGLLVAGLGGAGAEHVRLAADSEQSQGGSGPDGREAGDHQDGAQDGEQDGEQDGAQGDEDGSKAGPKGGHPGSASRTHKPQPQSQGDHQD